MRQWLRFFAKARGVTRHGALDLELDREVASHLVLLADHFEQNGMTPEEARKAARRAFGNVDQTKELSRDERSFVWMEQALQDLRHATRSLWHNPAFTVIAALTLALGIGVNATLFTVYNTFVLKPLPVADPDHVVRLERWYKDNLTGDIQYRFSLPEYTYARDHNNVFAGLAAASWPVRVTAGQNGETMDGELVSANYFSDLGIAGRAGRTFRPGEDLTNAPVIVLSDAYWQGHFNRDRGVVGRVVTLNETPFTVIGVAPEEFTGTSVGLQVPDFWALISAQKQLAPGPDWRSDSTIPQLQLLARIKAGVARKQARTEITNLILQYDGRLPQIYPTGSVTLQRTSFLGNTDDPRFRAAVSGVMLLVGLVLLTACANVANMLFARGAVRQQEVAIRLAVGASGGRVVRHLLTESLLLAGIGGAAGLVLSFWASRILPVFVQQLFAGPLTHGVKLHLNMNPDERVLAYTAAVSVAAAILFGLSPALRSSKTDLNAAIKSEGFIPALHLTKAGVRTMLVAGQVTFSTLLLITAVLLTRGLMRSVATGTGYETHRVLLLSANLGTDTAQQAALERRLVTRLKAVAGVRDVGLGHAPLMGTWTVPITASGPQGPDRARTLVSYASDGYFDTLGIGLLRGRLFTRREADNGTRVAVVSESAGRRFWPGVNPIGQRVRLDLQFKNKFTEFEVVGVVKDVRFANPTRVDPAHVYMPTTSADPYAMLVRVEGDVAPAEAAVRSAAGTVDRTLASSMVLVTLEDGPLRVHRQIAGLLADLGGILAVMATLLASAGIYGVMAFMVNQRVREIGVRMTLGATPGAVLSGVVVRGLRPVFAGIVCGVVAAGALSWLLHRGLASPETMDLLYGLRFYDPGTFVGVPVLVVFVAAAASVIPAQRALRVDPAVALRYQ